LFFKKIPIFHNFVCGKVWSFYESLNFVTTNAEANNLHDTNWSDYLLIPGKVKLSLCLTN
jgi:hypothetical protein